MTRLAVCFAAWLAASAVPPATAGAQERADTAAQRFLADSLARCDSAIAAARVEVARVNVRAYLLRTDDEAFPPIYRERIIEVIHSRLLPPRPLRIPIFSPGPVRMRMLRPEAVSDSSPGALRQPLLYGIYHLRLARDGSADSIGVTLPTGAPRFDSSVVSAIMDAAREKAFPPLRRDVPGKRVPLELRISNGPEDPRLRVPAATLFEAVLPRVPLVDAQPLPGNVAPFYPAVELDDGRDGEVLVRVVVGPDGVPDLRTVELIRSSSPAFALSALTALAAYRFSPARVASCAVAQAVDVPFWFSLRP